MSGAEERPLILGCACGANRTTAAVYSMLTDDEQREFSEAAAECECRHGRAAASVRPDAARKAAAAPEDRVA